MIPLFINRRVLTWFCLHPSKDGHNPIYIIFSVFIFLANVCSFTASVVFFYQFVNIDFEESLYSLFQVMGLFGGICTIITSYLSRNQIATVLNGLDALYDSSKEETQFKIQITY